MVTHFHPEGIAGAIAVAVAAGVSTHSRGLSSRETVEKLWKEVFYHTPESRVRDQLLAARDMPDASTAGAARALGNGSEISAQDTVPFCVWNACRCLGDFEEALISTVEVGGDCDTNAAIVCGIVAGYCGSGTIPEDWLRVREPLGIRFD